jgi:hypothetical protein
MAIPRYDIFGSDDNEVGTEIIETTHGDYYKGDDVVAAIRAACEGDTKADVVWFLADKFGIDMTDVEA